LKDSLEQIQQGDKVILSSRHGYSIKVVDRVTSTQIIIGDTKYRKNGSEITANSWASTSIHAPLAKHVMSDQTWLDCYEQQQQKIKDEKEGLISKINTFDLTKVSNQKLNQILEVLKG